MQSQTTLRRVVREVKSTSVLDQKYKREGLSDHPIQMGIHPWAVEIDLKKGCLKSLRDYLAQEQGIPDVRVVTELARLLESDQPTTPYQIIVVERQEVPKRKGGRPSVGGTPASLRQREIAYRCRELFEFYRKLYVAEQEAAKEFKVSVKTVQRAVRALEREEQMERDAENKSAADAAARGSREALRRTAIEAMEAKYGAGDRKNGHET